MDVAGGAKTTVGQAVRTARARARYVRCPKNTSHE
jgi:hypothetical protein